jgi:hypothetical protein
MLEKAQSNSHKTSEGKALSIEYYRLDGPVGMKHRKSQTRIVTKPATTHRLQLLRLRAACSSLSQNKNFNNRRQR